MSKTETIHIDPADFANQIPRDTDTGENIYDENDVLRFLVDQINAAGVDISMAYQDHEYGIRYQGQLDYFAISISSLDTPEGAVREGMVGLSDLLNDHADLKSWVEYLHGLYYLHIAADK
jgi:hypothetical protein